MLAKRFCHPALRLMFECVISVWVESFCSSKCDRHDEPTCETTSPSIVASSIEQFARSVCQRLDKLVRA